MASSSSSLITIGALFMAAIFLQHFTAQTEAQLTRFYYQSSCPKALSIIKKGVTAAVRQDKGMAAALIRLHFHDCFVLGCDASILLDKTSSVESEKDAAPNGSVRGYELIDKIKAEIESVCPGVFSCTDIVTVAARDASVSVGGPNWKVKLGRRDSRSASKTRAENDLPSFTSSIGTLIGRFQQDGLSPRDLVALSGAHTIGIATCFTFRDRIYANNTFIDPKFQSQRQEICSASSNSDNDNPADLDFVTPNKFDNNYYKILVRGMGLLTSDQNLYNGGGGPTDKFVLEYSRNQNSFYRDFGAAMIRMSQIRVLTGSHGEVRANCRKRN